MASRRPRIEAHDPAERLLSLSHDQFYSFVDRDVRAKLDVDLGEKLREPPVVERWHTVLVQMKKNVESQLASLRADFRSVQFQILSELEEAGHHDSDQGEPEEPQDPSDLRAELYDKIAKYEVSRAKKLRFRSSVEDSLSEARYLRNMQVEDRASTLLQLTRGHLFQVVDAVNQHRSQKAGDEDEDEYDHELWRIIDADGAPPTRPTISS